MHYFLCCAMMLTLFGGGARSEPCPVADDTLVARYSWTTGSDPAGSELTGSEPKGPHAPTLVPFHGGHALKFTRAEQQRLDLGQGADSRLRIKGAFTLLAVVQMGAVPPGKVSLVSKWRLAQEGRSYELGLTSSRQLFFTVSTSGTWPAQARELMSSRLLEVGKPYAVAAVFDPGKEMALFVNGKAGGVAREGIPAEVYDSKTPVLLGNRYGNEKSCAFEGLIGGVWIHGAALDKTAIAAWVKAQGSFDPPGPEFIQLEPPYDLDRIKSRTRAWYEALQAPGGPCGAYRLTLESPPDLYASADVAWIRWIMNDLDLTKVQREAWINFLQDQQNREDGSYRHITGHCKTHAFCHATGALNMLGGRQRYESKLLESYLDIGGIPAWLDGIDWVRQWGASHDIWGAGLPLVCTPETPDLWRENLFVWLDGANDPNTGFWRKGVKAKSPLEYLGGAFHIWPLYGAMDRPLPHPKRVIDSVLALQRSNGAFDGGFGYGNMDGVWVLDYLFARSAYRKKDVQAALERNLEGLMKVYNERLGSFLSSAHSTESRIATLAMLQSALPDRFRSKRFWRNPWHVRELFVIKN